MAPGVSAGSRRTRGATTVSQPAGKRPGRAGAAAGPGRGPGRAVPSAEGGGRAGAKVIPPPLLAGSPAPSAPLYPLPGASLASPPASLLRLAVPPHSAACPGPLHAAFPHTPRDRPAAAAGSGLGGGGWPPAAPPSSGPGGDAEPGGERRGSLRRPAGLGRRNSETCYLRAPAQRGLPARLHTPPPPTHTPPASPRPAGGIAPPPAGVAFARPAAGRFLAPGRRRGAGWRSPLGWWGAGGTPAVTGRGGEGAGGTPEERGCRRRGGTAAAAGSDSRGGSAARPPRAGGRGPAPPPPARRVRRLLPAGSWSPAAPRGSAASPPRDPPGQWGREGCSRAAGAGGEVSSLPSGFGGTCLYNNGW